LSAARALLLAAGLWAAAATGHAANPSLGLCDRASPLTAQQQDRLLRFADIVRRELDGSGQTVALIARSGLDLQRFGVRYSHAGISLWANDNTPWSVRQLYYACDAQRPRLFDQGLAGFLFGTDDPDVGYVSILLLPRAAAAKVEAAALDKPLALRLLGATYSANAYPFSLRYQNCNQWVMELLATAWGGPADGPDRGDTQDPRDPQDPRARAQAWLLDQGYAPPAIEVGSHLLMFAGAFIPWIRFDDHPEADRFALRFHTSMPASIAAFVQQRLPASERIELCHDARQVVIHRGWQPIADGCRPGAGDRVVALD
jgi:hypothetical protein